jgi:glycosyltransferase involved in cell wall biosynthesis
MGRDPEMLLRAWPTLSDVAEAVVHAGADVVVVQAADRDTTVERNGVAYHFVHDVCAPLPGTRQCHVLPRRLVHRLQSHGPDVVHVHGFTAPIATWWLQRAMSSTPLLVQDHGGIPARGWRRAIAARCYRGVSAVSFTDQEQARPFLEAGIVRTDVPVFDVPESFSRFTPGDRGEARRRIGVHGAPCIAFVGRLNANKDPLTVLEAFARASGSLPDPHLWCCYGEAPLLDLVDRRIAEDPALRGRVHLLGPLPHADVELLLRASDFLMLGSHREGSGYAVLEGLACGVTPIVTDIPSFRRLTDEGRIGSITPPGDAPAMARGLREWWDVPLDVRRQQALTFSARELSLAAVGRQLRAMYETVGCGQ